jgi:hypothetical protein
MKSNPKPTVLEVVGEVLKLEWSCRLLAFVQGLSVTVIRMVTLTLKLQNISKYKFLK